jgi:SAM-dependent methyltransferase
MNTGEMERQGHAVLDIPSRRRKGEKIARLMDGHSFAGHLRLLEVGTGSGGIAHYFATQVEPHYDVDGVDVTDTRMVSEGYRFTLVADTSLPFPDATFDRVITNHVIEHVGDATAQRRHLQEIRRVLKPAGRVYLAVPNRWMLVEPHYGLAFLSWLPRAWRTPYLRLRGKGNVYDCEPLQMRELQDLIASVGMSYRNVTVEAFRLTLAIEGDKGWLARTANAFPDSILRWMRRVIPTHIYLIEHGGPAHDE